MGTRHFVSCASEKEEFFNMEDSLIVELFKKRDQNAIVKTAEKYGRWCFSIAMNVLNNQEDSEECVNDTYHKAWDTIPPTIPTNLKIYIGRIVRNLAIDEYRKKHAKKRDFGDCLILSELEECIPSGQNVEKMATDKGITETINKWLSTLVLEDRALFVRRYFNCESVNDIAAEWNVRANKLSVKLLRLRNSLKDYLVKEGIEV